jgi:hypothetical protein
MQKLIQTRTVTTHKTGNCLQTAIACVLDLPIDEVPDFSTMYWKAEEYNRILKHYEPLYTKEKGMNELTLNRLNLWYLVLYTFVVSQGYDIKHYYPHKENILPEYDIDLWLKDHPNEFYLASGTSPRGVSHVVIYQNGKMYHDPHPSQAGLKEDSIYEYKIFVKL